MQCGSRHHKEAVRSTVTVSGTSLLDPAANYVGSVLEARRHRKKPDPCDAWKEQFKCGNPVWGPSYSKSGGQIKATGDIDAASTLSPGHWFIMSVALGTTLTNQRTETLSGATSKTATFSMGSEFWMLVNLVLYMLTLFYQTSGTVGLCSVSNWPNV